MNKKLKKYFGYDSFMEKQEEIIKDALTNIDQFVLLPTGSGKSICYQLPAILQNGVTIVISPLKSLIKDQIAGLTNKGIKVYGFYGNTSSKDKKELLNNMLNPESDIKLIYTTPETLDSNTEFNDNLHQLYIDGRLRRFVIDEAHCISLWGNDFRSSYRELCNIRENYEDIPIMALTATATNQVLKDSIHLLGLEEPKIYTKSYYRSNLNIIVKQRDKSSLLEIVDFIKEKYENDSGIIYCLSRKKCEELSEKLNNQGINSLPYHAGLTDKVRNVIQENWQKGETNLIVATIAFGMGIDKPDVRYVIHYNLPGSIENYYQEIGRAGRDGNRSDCLLYYSYQDKVISEHLIRKNVDDYKNNKYIEHQLEKLNTIVNYADNITDCRHCQVSNYLGEMRKYENLSCKSSCDNCNNVKELINMDVSDICKIIFNGIMELDKPTKKNIKLHFSNSENFFPLINKYGSKREILKMYDRIFMHLIVNKYLNEELKRNNYGYWTEKYRLYSKCKKIIFNEDKIIIPFR
uniref:DNA 3'-5' helicase n=1 Tax=viral metagenome TaxID=1070528 RepID=A0A6C0JHW9_9ZZZZ